MKLFAIVALPLDVLRAVRVLSEKRRELKAAVDDHSKTAGRLQRVSDKIRLTTDRKRREAELQGKPWGAAE